MAFVAKGVDIALRESPGRPGRFDIDWDTTGANKGNPKFSDDRAHAVISTLVSRKRGRAPGSKVEEGGYYWDTSGRRGTLLWTIKNDTRATGSRLVAYAEDAGEQLVNDGIITSLSATATKLAPGRWRLDVKWTLPGDATPQTTTLSL